MAYESLHDIFLQYPADSVGERVCNSIRTAIINHQIPPGERLVEAKVAQALHVSITPVRYAFTQLANEGPIDVIPYCGTYVKTLSKQFVREVCEVRALLECAAAESAFEKITYDDIMALQEQVTLLCRPVGSFRTTHEACMADTRFHDIIFERSGNKTLIQFWQILRARMEFITSFTKERDDCELQMQRHSVLVDDLIAKDKEKFLRDLHAHCIEPNYEFFSED